jgi:hypothetical protein
LYNFENIGLLPPEALSMFRYNQAHGAQLVTATATGITYQFYAVDGSLVDEHRVAKECAGGALAPPLTAAAASTPTGAITASVSANLPLVGLPEPAPSGDGDLGADEGQVGSDGVGQTEPGLDNQLFLPVITK